MSRIEQAIEKAAKLRAGSTGAQQAPKPERAASLERSQTKGAEPGSPAVHVGIDNPYIISLREPGSPVSEEYRKLKSNIVKLTSQNGFMNTLMVTSTLGGEGKSITSLNLAITLSLEYDHTVLLVDCDIRKPSLHKYLNIESKAGITECLLGEARISDAIIKTDIGKLSFLPAGKRVDNPVELLSSQKMKDLIRELKERYHDRYIIIDTPPILPFAETRAISSMVSGVIFVVKECGASMHDIGEAIDVLKGTNVLGIVYNGVSKDSLNTHYQYYYY